MSDTALRQQLRTAEESAEDWQRRAQHAEAQLRLATIRMQQAEDTMRGMVEQCVACSRGQGD